MFEAASSSEMSVTVYHLAQHHIPEDVYLNV
jgi:hypothetical protein